MQGRAPTELISASFPPCQSFSSPFQTGPLVPSPPPAPPLSVLAEPLSLWVLTLATSAERGAGCPLFSELCCIGNERTEGLRPLIIHMLKP